MNLPEEAPKLNPLPFIIADLVLLVTALLIAVEAPSPLSGLPLIAITACVCLGAILACLPIVLNYTRRRDALLDERQDQLVSLTQSAAASANQLSIAASNLGNIAESTAKMLKHADTLPTRLQEKIGDFKTQLNEINITENDALEQEINTLRNSETERLETALASIKKLADDILARENTAQKHSDEIARKLAHLPAEFDTASKALAAQLALQLNTQITAALATARRDLENSVNESLERRNKETLARLTNEIAAIETGIKARLEKWLAELPAPPAAPAPLAAPASADAATPPAQQIQAHPKNASKPEDSVTSNSDDDLPAANSEPPFKKTPKHPPASPRIHEKSKAEKPSNTPPSKSSTSKSAEAHTSDEPAAPPAPSPENAEPQSGNKAPAAPETPPSKPITPPPAAEQPPHAHAQAPAPVPVEQPAPAKTTPPAGTTPPVSETPPPPSAETPEAPKSETPADDAAASVPPAPPPPPAPRKRTPKPKPQREEEPMLDLDLPPPADEYSQSSPDETGGFSSAMSADGITRLIVTAYIGIGNKLFIRGDGPGLSWEKGVPLQFISIGKWRWESHDAAAPISFKLYKNDTAECTRIGSPKLEPGHQHEVTASF